MCLFYFFRMVIVLYRRRPKASHREDDYFDDDRLYTSNIFSGDSMLLDADEFTTYGDGVPKTVTDTRGGSTNSNKSKESAQKYRDCTGDRASMG
jgi:hypothetical protein